MKFPQFRVRTLLLLTAIMGVVFVACAKWPVTLTEVVTGAPIDGTFIPDTPEILTTGTRPPIFAEWAIRAGIAAGILLGGVAGEKR
jgi:hypothetical protein